MSLTQLLVFGALACVYGVVFKGRGRNWFLLAVSVGALYWLQPSTPIRNLDFWLPTASLGLSVIVWAATRPGPGAWRDRSTLLTLGVVAAIVLLIALDRYLEVCCLTPSRPPDIGRVLVALLVLGVLVFGAAWAAGRSKILALLIVGLIVLFIFLKSDTLAQGLAAGLRAINGQAPDQASAFDIRWLGFSYLAFRLIATLRERMLGKLPELSLQEFLIFAVFFPALTAGPIDRVERFIKDLRAPFVLTSEAFINGGWRMVWGVFKKFAVADALALMSLNGVNAAQTSSTFWLWVLLYAYAFRIYFDFSGYTDIAIGLGLWCGIKLPENFDRPYTKQNLTLFWNSWHMTLSQWFRTYYFNPVTRALRSRNLPMVAIIFITQFTTMLLIGLWHGIAWNFIIWGAWHGLGLFIHNRWADYTKPRANALDGRPVLKRLAAWGGVVLTFHFVALGWLWFVIPDAALGGRVLLNLFGVHP